MRFSVAAPLLFLLSCPVSLVAAAPVESDAIQVISREETATDGPVTTLGTMVVTVYSGDSCSGSNSQFTVTNGGYRCVPVSNARSLSVSGSNCYVTTWSGQDCRGSSYNVQYQGCHGVLFGSVEVQCL